MGSFVTESNQPHVAASPPKAKLDPPMESQAVEQMAACYLSRKAGREIAVPGWVVYGFGRATVWRGNPNVANKERALATQLVKTGRTAKDIWGGDLSADEATVLRASLMDYLAYGPGASKFPAFVQGFQPDENNVQQVRTTAQALQAANINADQLDRGWRSWATRR